ncbi:MAG: hypothetical protein RI572_13350 [Salegentibacter sp.]|uniref:hypothetical protein n=1 Tax=Salegentibacter sp. TaxID=1903072 RepID=UPI0028708406|nr:hypothetical protein [Salegentibacter sp.]MDR9458385.1 hypothetical protein [Salegentibacter sp.]
MRILLQLFCLLILVGCKSDVNAEANEQTELDSTLLAKNINLPDTEVELLPEARKHAVQWVNYITAQNEINNLKSANLSQIIGNAKPISQIMQSLKSTVPDTLQSKAVDARLNVLATKAQVLEQLAARRNKNLEQISETAQDIPVEFNNFKLQLNELFLKSLEDFERELDELDQEQDSISRATRRIKDSV